MTVVVDSLPGSSRVGRAENPQYVVDLPGQIQCLGMTPGRRLAEPKVEGLLRRAGVGEARAGVCGMEQSTARGKPEIAFRGGGGVEVPAGQACGGGGRKRGTSVGA